MADDRIVISSEPGLTPDEIVRRSFPVAFRGYDQDQVRHYLRRIADELIAGKEREQELRSALEQTRGQLAHPELDEATLTAALGEETTRILRSAREAAADLRAKAEEGVARMLQEADEHASRLRLEAENVLANRVEEADELAANIRKAAEADAHAVHDQVQHELEAVRARGKEMIAEAQAVRERVLADLSRRRRVAQSQIEQLLAGRDRLIESYGVVRRTLDEVGEELNRAEDHARLAAEAAAHRAATAPLPEIEPEPPAAPPPAAEVNVPPTTPLTTPAPTAPAAAETEAGPRPEQEPSPASQPPAADEPGPRPSLVRLQPHDEEEGVRIIGPVHGADAQRQQEQQEPPEVHVAPAHAATSAEQAGPGVEDLFARLRAEREQAVVRAEEVLAAEPHAPAEAEPTPGAEAELVLRPPADEEPAAEATSPEVVADGTGPDEDGLIVRRDECLEPVAADLVRRLKRVLQDEQNEILDRLRQSRGRTRVEEALPSAADQAGRYRDAAAEPLGTAARAGAELLGFPAPAGLPARTWASELGSELVTGLRDRVSLSLPAGDDNGDADLAEALGAVYRQWKTERVEQIARHHLAAAFNQGAFAAAPDGTSLRWVFGDAGPCPDCDDNVLAGATPRGDPFPTGQLHPPAHAGCGCVIAVVGDAAR